MFHTVSYFAGDVAAWRASDQSGGNQDTWQSGRRPMKRAPNKTKPSFFRVTRGTPVEEAAANEKKREFSSA